MDGPFGVCDFARLAVTDWSLRRWRLWFLALPNAPHSFLLCFCTVHLKLEKLYIILKNLRANNLRRSSKVGEEFEVSI